MKKEQKENQEPKDCSEAVSIFALVLLVVGFLAVYFAGAGGINFKNAVIKTEKAYVQKVEEIETIKKDLEDEEVEKVKIPYNKYSFNYIYTLNVSGNAKRVTFKVAVPKDENQKQYISKLSMSPSPIRTYSDGVNNIAEFVFDNVVNKKLNISISGIAEQRTYDYELATAYRRNPHKESDLSMYVKPAQYIESNDPGIVRTASTLVGKTQRETVDNTFNYLQKNMKYNINAPQMGAKDVLVKKQGKCVDYSNLMVALLRANKIPARYVVGYMIKEGYNYHAWVEVYYKNYGWVAYDPTISAMTNSQGVKGVIDPSKSLGRRYIASARNMVSAYTVSYQMSGKNRANVSLSENIKIRKAEE